MSSNPKRHAQLLPIKNAKLAATNAKLSRSLDARGAQLLQLKSLIAGYAAGPPGATNPACAGVAGRAKVLGDVLSGGLGLAQESLGLLQRGLELLGADEKLDSDLANDAEQLAVLLRGWQDRYHTVEPPPR